MGRFVRTIGVACARTKIGMANLAYNLARSVWPKVRTTSALWRRRETADATPKSTSHPSRPKGRDSPTALVCPPCRSKTGVNRSDHVA
ncbi:MAG: hypothetical protein EOR05_19625 [Mesorhizobium sp.]|nr:MAG: hypothetical protein EOR05_19625 [Mesorhizobium sp.]